MGLRAWAKRQFGRGPEPERRYGPAFDAWNMGRVADVLGAAGANVTPKSALTLAAYFAALNVLSTDLACLPLKLYRRKRSGGRDEVTDDRRADLLATSPDGETTSMRWRQAIYGHTFGGGNGYAEIGYSGGEVEGFYLLDSGTEPQRRAQDKRLYYRLPDGTTRPPYRVLHFAGFGCDGLCGYSVARLMRDAIRLGKSAEVFGAAFFDNGTQSSGFFEFPHKMDEAAQRRWRQEVNAFHQSASNAFKFMLLEGGTKFTPSTVPPEDIQFLSVRQFQVLEIARAFRLPPHKLGDYSQSHLANIEESNIDYMTTTLMPWCESIEQELNRKLLTEDERRRGYYFEHQMNAFLRGNMGARAAFYQSMFGLGVYSRNRIAELENENPVGPEGDELFVTVQAQPLKSLLNPPEPAPPPAAPAEGGGQGEPPATIPIAANRVARALAAVGANGHAPAARHNPNHGADGKFARSPSPLAVHAPKATATGAAIEVHEGPPESKADATFAERAAEKGKQAFRLTDTPRVDVERTADATDYRVGGEMAKRVEWAEGEWRIVSYDKDGGPLPESFADSRKTREKAEAVAAKDARAIQKQDTVVARVATADPAGYVAQGKSAHREYYDPRRGGSGPDRTNASWTTSYYHIKTTATEEKSRRPPARRFNPNHGADGKFAHTASPLAAHAPKTTAAGSRLEVVEGPPQTKGDAAFAEKAAEQGKAAFRVSDKPDLDVARADDATEYHVGGQISNRVQRYEGVNQHGEDVKGWQVVHYDRYESVPLPIGPAGPEVYYGRKQAERNALRSAKAEQKFNSHELRLATNDPEGFVARGKSAHDLAEMPAKFNRVNAHYTTTYYHIKPPEKGD